MNEAENEQNPNRSEVAPRREVTEVSTGERNRELRQLLENHKHDRIQKISSETQTALGGSSKRLESAVGIGYSPEQLQAMRRESGMDGQLEQNRQQIEALGTEARSRLEEIDTHETENETPKILAPERMETNTEREKVIEEAQEKRGNMLSNVLTSEMVSNGLDLVPFAGSGKILVEGLAGKTLDGKKLTGKERIIHAAMGAGSLALDFTGIGEAKDIALIAGKSVGLVEKVGAKLAERGEIKGAKIFLATSEFMAKHPELTAKAEQFAETKLNALVREIKAYKGAGKEASAAKEVATGWEKVSELFGKEIGGASEQLLNELKAATPDVPKIKKFFADLGSKIHRAQSPFIEEGNFANEEYKALMNLEKKAGSEVNSKLKQLFEGEMSAARRNRLEAPVLSAEQIEKAANYAGDHTELMVQRLKDPEINDQLTRLVHADRNYDLSIMNVPTLEEIKAQEQATITAVSEYTPVTFTGEMPSANMLDDVRESMDVYFENPKVFGENSIRQKNIFEAHEKGHTIRKIRSEAAQDYFKKGFDFNKMSIPPEKLNQLKEFFHGQHPDSPVASDAEIYESIASYLSNPMESAERMSQLKNYFGMKDGEIFTKEHLDYARKHYVQDTKVDNHMTEFFQAITTKTEAAFLEIINKVGI